MKVKKKQLPKKGKVARLVPELAKLVSDNQCEDETVSAVLLRLLDHSDPPMFYYILPESRIVCDTAAEARGTAILRAVRRGKKPTEKPLKVRVV